MGNEINGEELDLSLRRGNLYRVVATSASARVLAIGNAELTDSLRPLPFSNLMYQPIANLLDPAVRPEIDGAFDLIILHNFFHQLDVPAQNTALTACRGLLTIGGVLAISVENRLSYQRLAGFVGRQHPATPAKSYWGYKRQLHAAGFVYFRAFAVLPHLADPYFIVSTQRDAAAAYYRHELEKHISRNGWRKNVARYLLTRLNLYRYLEQAFLLTVEKP